MITYLSVIIQQFSFLIQDSSASALEIGTLSFQRFLRQEDQSDIGSIHLHVKSLFSWFLFTQHLWIWMRPRAREKESPTTLSRSRVASEKSWRSTAMASGYQSCLRSTESCTNRTYQLRPSKTWRPGATYVLYVVLCLSNCFCAWETLAGCLCVFCAQNAWYNIEGISSDLNQTLPWTERWIYQNLMVKYQRWAKCLSVCITENPKEQMQNAGSPALYNQCYLSLC